MPIEMKAGSSYFRNAASLFQRFIQQNLAPSVVYHDLVPICVDCNLKQDCLDGFISATGVNIFVQHSLGSSIITN